MVRSVWVAWKVSDLEVKVRNCLSKVSEIDWQELYLKFLVRVVWFESYKSAFWHFWVVWVWSWQMWVHGWWLYVHLVSVNGSVFVSWCVISWVSAWLSRSLTVGSVEYEFLFHGEMEAAPLLKPSPLKPLHFDLCASDYLDWIFELPYPFLILDCPDHWLLMFNFCITIHHLYLLLVFGKVYCMFIVVLSTLLLLPFLLISHPVWFP